MAASWKGPQSGPTAKVTVCMQQTLSSRLEEMRSKGTLPKCDVLVIDEMHISHDTQTMNEIKEALRPNNIVGLSATPIDEKGASLKNVEIIETETVKELTEAKYLTKAHTFILKYAQQLDFSDIGDGADYTDPEVDLKLNNPEYNLAVFKGWIEAKGHSSFLKTIVFVSTIEHAKSTAETFSNNGIKAEAYHSKMSPKDREYAMENFKVGSIEVMVSVSSLIAGFDMPDIECGIMCRPTKRVRTYLQAIGRILRLHPDPLHNKHDGAIWIDAAKVTQEHGLYDVPYNFSITDSYELKEYKTKRAEPYISNICKKNTATEYLTIINSSVLEAAKVRIEGDTSLEGLIERYEAATDIRKLLALGYQISRALGKPVTVKTQHFIEETCVPYVKDGGSLKAIKTRMRNIIKDGKKLAALHYFPKWLREQSWA